MNIKRATLTLAMVILLVAFLSSNVSAFSDSPNFPAPDIKSVSDTNAPLKGLAFGGESCTKYGTSDWTCVDLGAYGFTDMSKVSYTQALTASIPLRSGSGTSCLSPTGDMMG